MAKRQKMTKNARISGINSTGRPRNCVQLFWQERVAEALVTEIMPLCFKKVWRRADTRERGFEHFKNRGNTSISNLLFLQDNDNIP